MQTSADDVVPRMAVDLSKRFSASRLTKKPELQGASGRR